jgi:Xaa-Pro aminopeptidase
VLQEQACLWTDGRYFLQAAEQLQGSGVTLMKDGEAGTPSIFEFLKNLGAEAKVCLDYKIATVGFVQKLLKTAPNITLVDNSTILDEVWTDRPAMVKSKAWVLLEKRAGESMAHKVQTLQEDLKAEGCDYALIAALDDIAWLYNLRGDDILYNPVNYAYSLVGENGAVLYIDEAKCDEKVRAYLAENNVQIKPYSTIYDDVKNITGKVLIDTGKTNYALFNLISDKKEAKIFPTTKRKAVKNNAEIAGEKRAHILDAVAMVKFFYYLKTRVGKEDMTEITLADRLEAFRRESKDFIELSFDTICGYAAHGAIVHYSATPDTDVSVLKDGFLLVDSGATYTMGTTDITRTFALGHITSEMKKHYTLVLKSHIALASAVFPAGTSGYALDMLAREPLYREFLDFRHGTGHGVGHVLNVHEGPQRIAVRAATPETLYPMQAGMVTSDEPGVYIAEKYGIRHENLVLCKQVGHSEYGDFLGFEPLTYVPFDKDGIQVSLLSQEERDWLNAYHKACYQKVAKYLNDDERAFLQKATAPV